MHESDRPDETFVLVEGKPFTTENGLVFVLEETITGWISKEPDSPICEVANYDLHISKEGKTETVGFTYDPQEQLYLEGAAFGQLYSTTHSGSGFVVELHGSPPSEPMSEAEAMELAKRTVRERGLSTGNYSSAGFQHGTFRVGFMNAEGDNIKPICTLVIGLYTRRVISFKIPPY